MAGPSVIARYRSDGGNYQAVEKRNKESSRAFPACPTNRIADT